MLLTSLSTANGFRSLEGTLQIRGEDMRDNDASLGKMLAQAIGL